MFSGIVEAQVRAATITERPGVLELVLPRPEKFHDIQIGDSIAVNGVCLTVESVSAAQMSFAIGRETQRVTGWSEERLSRMSFNLERSLKFGDRMHGHMVSGHVDGMGEIEMTETQGEGRDLLIRFPEALKPMIWVKGSIAVNGVSLTINAVRGSTFKVGLIPETLKRTNLRSVEPGDQVTLEVDTVARGLVHWLETRPAGEAGVM